jgi:hypothetical protein
MAFNPDLTLLGQHRGDFMHTYAKPTHLMLVRHRANNHTFYSIDKIYNTSTTVFGQRRFTTTRDATDYANREWHGVPLIVETNNA